MYYRTSYIYLSSVDEYLVFLYCRHVNNSNVNICKQVFHVCFYFGVIYLGEELIAHTLVLFFSCRTIMKQVATVFYDATPGV